MMFPKGSQLNAILTKSFEAYLKSDIHQRVIKKHLGSDAITYFRRGFKKVN
jgi:hypothetical protein